MLAAIENFEKALKAHDQQLEKIHDDLQQVILQNQRQSLRGSVVVNDQLMFVAAMFAVQALFIYFLLHWKN